jgi:hypothetical protein
MSYWQRCPGFSDAAQPSRRRRSHAAAGSRTTVNSIDALSRSGDTEHELNVMAMLIAPIVILIFQLPDHYPSHGSAQPAPVTPQHWPAERACMADGPRRALRKIGQFLRTHRLQRVYRLPFTNAASEISHVASPPRMLCVGSRTSRASRFRWAESGRWCLNAGGPARLGVRSMIGGLLASYLTACDSGLLIGCVGLGDA